MSPVTENKHPILNKTHYFATYEIFPDKKSRYTGRLSLQCYLREVMLKIEQHPNHYLLRTRHTPESLSSDWFDVTFWQRQNAVVTSKQGRAAAWFVRYATQQVAVLKHYWRGGLIGKVLKDQYLFTGLKNTRVYLELDLLTQLASLGLPVPTPLGARVTVSAGIYRADILTDAISGAQSLCERLQSAPLPSQDWQQVATTLARFHHAGAYHDDLNCNNILFDDQGNVYLIDFDKGALKMPAKEWQMANIERLARSLKKEASRSTQFFCTEQDWQGFIDTYQGAMTKKPA
ncbi:3-deoxy-D-manno-octulosonic acid kinase [Pseudoalteromonas sp. DL2-H2.2]|uniref:3-deoxy-D-manno-octulosonic acid kinase n=1 Tax=Pseudoalteromonas sp. DL2-H2.2 TaxID=2908889 RepID=UPI001F43E528|nr:3-deoxy-D-manno-octulosonic acid kinase [Pseudoalteromonas sp. DL2-H2.2]MCF2907465.1 3-deoxy-D-manno-octulosonic acid kinase [Pseudoalteromonas sp. DL2-H2.2]